MLCFRRSGGSRLRKVTSPLPLVNVAPKKCTFSPLIQHWEGEGEGEIEEGRFSAKKCRCPNTFVQDCSIDAASWEMGCLWGELQSSHTMQPACSTWCGLNCTVLFWRLDLPVSSSWVTVWSWLSLSLRDETHDISVSFYWSVTLQSQDFKQNTADCTHSSWKVSTSPPLLLNRREIRISHMLMIAG